MPNPEHIAGELESRSSYWDWGVDDSGGALVLRENEVPHEHDLLERTARFGESVIRFLKRVPRGVEHPENNRLVDQLAGASSSIGANYCEADDAVSGRDFKNKIGICRKESKETMFFLRMLSAAEPQLTEEARTLWREAKELNLIFGSIWRKTS